MKGTTIHRFGLTKEKMNVLALFTQKSKKQPNAKTQLNNYYKNTKNQELDILWGSVQKGVQKVHNATKSSAQRKSPLLFLFIGFIAGVLFMSCITLIVSISAIAPSAVNGVEEKKVEVVEEVATTPKAAQQEGSVATTTQEKYIIKKGDTIAAIAYRFYGKWSDEKINEILRVNGISNPSALKIGQELIIPVSQER